MNLMISTLLWVLAAGAAAHVTPPQRDVAPAKDEEFVTIAGCVQGRRLKPAMATSPDLITVTLHASEYTLDGHKEILNRLKKDHDNHFEEITGVLKITQSAGEPDVRVRTKDVGKKTRITIGNRQGTSSEAAAAAPSAVPPRIVVLSFKHVADKCAAR
jgi:hypothetical protein